MKKLILFLCILFVTVSCSSNDDNFTQQDDDNPTQQDDDTTQDNHEIIATWSLVKFEVFEFGETFIYTNEIIWTFDSDNTVNVEIQNGTNVSTNLPLNISGIYPYTIECVASGECVVTLDNGTGYLTETINNELILLIGSPSFGGRQLTFQLVD